MKFNRWDVSVLHCSLFASCFSYFTVNISKDFCVMAVAKEKSRLVLLNVVPTSRPAPLANAAVEIPPVITVGVIRPISTMLAIALSHFMFFASHSRTWISCRKYASISVNFLSDMFEAPVEPQSLNLDIFCFFIIVLLMSFI